MMCKLSKDKVLSQHSESKDEMKAMEETESTVIDKKEEYAKHSDTLSQFKNRHDMKQSQLKQSIKEDGVFSVVENINQTYELEEIDIDRSFVNKIKSNSLS
jgi:hypothetical protein